MKQRRDPRAMLRDALLAEEERLHDLRAALAALTIMASTRDGIDSDDLIGLRFLTRITRDLGDALHHAWRDAVERLGTP